MFNLIDHPLMSVRAYECDEWSNSEQYVKTVRYLAGDQSVLGDLDLSVREIPMIEASKFYIGKNYHEVCDMLIDAGFSDIKAVKTIEKGLLTKIEQTVKIQINDNDVFEKGAWYPEDSTIVITYYEPETEEEIAAAHAGQTQFSKGDWFAPDSKIRITYQTVVEEK